VARNAGEDGVLNWAIAKALPNSIPLSNALQLLDKCIIGGDCSLDHSRRRRFFMDADLGWQPSTDVWSMVSP
jgi:hypothetical protein